MRLRRPGPRIRARRPAPLTRWRTSGPRVVVADGRTATGAHGRYRRRSQQTDIHPPSRTRTRPRSMTTVPSCLAVWNTSGVVRQMEITGLGEEGKDREPVLAWREKHRSAVVVPPDGDHQRLAGQDRAGEPAGHRAEPGRFDRNRVQQRPAGDPVGTGRGREPAPGGELRVGVQRVAVTGQPVQQRLLRPGLLLDPQVGVTFGPLPTRVPRRCRPAGHARRRTRPRR